MKKIIQHFFILAFIVLVFACKSNEEKKPTEVVATVSDTINYYPVNFFLGEDIRAILLSKAKIYKTVAIGKAKGDAIAIDSVEFNSLANKFLEKDITESSVKRFYKESVFRSLSTNSITFNYTSVNPALDVKTVDANVNDGDNKLNRIDIRVIFTKGDSSFTENYCWLPGTKFYITRYAEGADKKGVLTTTTVTWHK